MNDLAFKKKPTKVIKSYGLSPDAVTKIEELHKRHGVPKSQIIDEMLLFGDTEVMEHIFVYAIEAMGKGRPRFGKGKTYTDDNTKKYEHLVNKALGIWWRDEVVTGPVKCSLTFQFKEPKKSAKGYPAKKDLDNLVKAWLDAANKVIWKDDMQVIDIRASKTFGPDDRVTFGFSQLGRTDLESQA